VVGIPEAPAGVHVALGPDARAAAVLVDVAVVLHDYRKDEAAGRRRAAGVVGPLLLPEGNRCRHCSSEAARRQMSSRWLEPVLLAE
jgi:hypothetical protein